MNSYTREELMEMFGYSFQVFKAVADLEDAILRVQDIAANKVMGIIKNLDLYITKFLQVLLYFVYYWEFSKGRLT